MWSELNYEVRFLQPHRENFNGSSVFKIPGVFTFNFFLVFSEKQVIAESLWDHLKEDTTQFHHRIVQLFLQLHNLTPSPSLCANVIGNSLVDISKVSNKLYLLRGLFIFISLSRTLSLGSDYSKLFSVAC